MYSQQGYHVEEIALLLTLPSLCIGLGQNIVTWIIPAVWLTAVQATTSCSQSLWLMVGDQSSLLRPRSCSPTIWAATQNSYKSHLGARVLSDLATGASESLLPLMLSEVTFLHERGKIMAVYWGVQNILTGVFTIVASYEVADLGWRW